METTKKKNQPTIYALQKDGKELITEVNYKSTLSAVFRQVDSNTLEVILDDRLNSKGYTLPYLCGITFCMVFFLPGLYNGDISLFGFFLAFILFSVFILAFLYYKLNFVYEYTFNTQESKFVRSRLRLTPRGVNIADLGIGDVDRMKTSTTNGLISYIICYKGNIGIESPYSIYFSDARGKRTTFVNATSKQQVLDYGTAIADFLQIPLEFEKYRHKAKDWRQDPY